MVVFLLTLYLFVQLLDESEVAGTDSEEGEAEGATVDTGDIADTDAADTGDIADKGDTEDVTVGDNVETGAGINDLPDTSAAQGEDHAPLSPSQHETESVSIERTMFYKVIDHAISRKEI